AAGVEYLARQAERLADHGAERGVDECGLLLREHRVQPVADQADDQRDDDGRRQRASSPPAFGSTMRRLPASRAVHPAPGGSTNVDSRSSTRAGPSTRVPGASRYLSYTGVSTKPSPKYARLLPFRAGAGSTVPPCQPRATRGRGPGQITRQVRTSAGT